TRFRCRSRSSTTTVKSLIFSDRLISLGILDSETDERLQSEARTQINAVTDEVEAAVYPDTDDFFEHVYAVGN
ncbi:MAG: hypothetical protein OXG80_00255, partial [Chloroflexi bacterium]|nr:hypothetical protein [Chloroflexota bacterium]